MAEEDSIFSFIADIIPTKDIMQGSKVVEDFEPEEDEEKKEQEQEQEQGDLDIFLPKEDTGIVTPIKKKRKIKYLSPIPEGSNESMSRDNTPSKTIIVPEIETTPKKKKLKKFLVANSINL